MHSLNIIKLINAFKIGENVIYTPTNDSAEVISPPAADPVTGEKLYEVEFLDKNLIPPRMTIKERYLKSAPVLINPPYGTPPRKKHVATPDDGEHCPICGTKYSIRPLLTSNWEGCDRCNLSKKEAAKRNENYEDFDLVKEFERLIKNK